VVITNVQAGNIAANVGGQGGTGGKKGYLDQRGARVVGSVGGDSASFLKPFIIPSELTSQLNSYYGGGGGGGFGVDMNSSGGAGNGQGGGRYDHSIGQSAYIYGGGGGGSVGKSPGGNGGDGVMIFFFPKSEIGVGTIAPTASYLTMTTVTQNQTTISPVYMVTTKSPMPLLGMTIWLDAKSLVGSSILTEWKNQAPNSTNNAIVFNGKIVPNATDNTIINGLPGVNFSPTGGSPRFYVSDTTSYNNGTTMFIVFYNTSNTPQYSTLVSCTVDRYPSPFDMYNNYRVIGNGTDKFTLVTSSTDLKNLPLNKAYLYVLSMSVSDNATARVKQATLTEWLNGNKATLSGSYVNAMPYGNTATQIRIGTRADLYTQFNGYMGEIVIYNRTLSDDEIVNTMLYLKNKWKIV